MSDAGFEELDHTADWSLRVWAPNLAGLIMIASQGMLTMAGAVPAGQERVRRRVELRADDREGLLVSWLEDLLFHLETRQVTATAFTCAVHGSRVIGEVEEAPSTTPEKPIKAITYHNLAIRDTADGLETTIVFDV